MWKLWKQNSVGIYIEKDVHSELKGKKESKIATGVESSKNKKNNGNNEHN